MHWESESKGKYLPQCFFIFFQNTNVLLNGKQWNLLVRWLGHNARICNRFLNIQTHSRILGVTGWSWAANRWSAGISWDGPMIWWNTIMIVWWHSFKILITNVYLKVRTTNEHSKVNPHIWCIWQQRSQDNRTIIVYIVVLVTLCILATKDG